MNAVCEREGIEKIYIAPFRNETSKSGVEILVYNEVVRRLGGSGVLKIVQNPRDADAILTGSVGGANYSVSSSEQVMSRVSVTEFNPATGKNDLVKKDRFGRDISIPNSFPKNPYLAVPEGVDFGNQHAPTEFRAGLSAGVQLRKRSIKQPEGETVWSGGFGREKAFPGMAVPGPAGFTSHLINESAFDRALRDLAALGAADIEQGMFSQF
jgi:hypothetical protein